MASACALRLECPVCSHEWRDDASVPCARCGFVLADTNNILRALPAERELHFRQFVCEYELVRTKEGRGSSSPDYYLALPFKDLSSRNTSQWKIRAKTWQYMAEHLLPKIERGYPNGCDVLDVGAGNCWLSYRLALRGHRPAAVDLLDNDTDGVGAARHYAPHLPRMFLRFQAEMDRMPFAPNQFDVVIFNASFHYSINYEQTLKEALRCLRRPGHVIVADSPFYWHDESGQTMVTEKHAAFEARFGFRSDSIESQEYLTPAILDEFAKTLQLDWSVIKPWYGINWALRPIKARLLRRRERAKFYLLWAKVHNS